MEMQGHVALVTLSLFIGIAGAAISTPPSLYANVTNAEYDKSYTSVVNTSIEYVFLYSETNTSSTDGARIKVQSNATRDLPLIIVVRQEKGILSWQIPYVVESSHFETQMYNTTSRTLCSSRYCQRNLLNHEEFVTVSISTASTTNIDFEMTVYHIRGFYLRLDENRTIDVSPAEPVYYGYTFPGQAESSSVVVRVESNSDTCMTVSIQNISCPVFDLERNIQFSGYWQTVSRRGGITVPRDAYPLGFFVVFVVKGDDVDCTGSVKTSFPRSKTVFLLINATVTKHDYLVASIIIFGLTLVFCTFYLIGVILFRIRHGRRLNEELLNNLENTEHNISSSSTVGDIATSQWASIDEDSSLDEDDIDILEDAFSDKEVIRTKLVLSVCDLARKDPKILRHKSRLYLYYLVTVAVFYTLPVIQLVITYQNVLHVTGNQDLCYYNFLCAHPLGFLSDFNHVFSNFGYIVLGLLFILLTYTKEQKDQDNERNKSYGIPQHYGLFYAMGTALMMEGVLSGSYHLCPNHSNFQFDTSFMYIMAVLCMVKIYQTRHPDINARAPVTFGVLALMIFFGLVGVLDGSRYFWIIFSIIHLSTCLALTAQIYYMGRWKFNGGLLRRVVMTARHDARAGLIYLVRPIYGARLVLLVIANLCNLALAIFGNMHHEKDFDTYLLAVLMTNLLLYMVFYIVMKVCVSHCYINVDNIVMINPATFYFQLCHREWIMLEPLIYIILAILVWGAALYFFINKSISWALTPAQSRLYNKPCELLNFFDSHDIWHFLSALAMFFSFMVLSTLDDDLVNVHRSQIPVF
ncbi:SID1 transmembrane family member 2 isoform X2 [Orussus abietinus]|nr:SID1 transmembrane family member 2 isoform X2 [Orussus abietinus]XP_023290690.1 SID1 transmembrane family member 2 isoform X2 [Orussus abietinus]